MNDELIADAEIGDEARRFLESNLGKKLCELADERHTDALVALAKVDPHNTIAIMKLQNQAQLFEQFDSWLRELVDKGDQALNVWRQENEQSK